MEPEGSSPDSQVPATRPYPEPAWSSPYPPHSTSSKSILILYSHLRLGLQICLFPFRFPHQNLSSTPHALHAPRILFNITEVK